MFILPLCPHQRVVPVIPVGLFLSQFDRQAITVTPFFPPPGRLRSCARMLQLETRGFAPLKTCCSGGNWWQQVREWLTMECEVARRQRDINCYHPGNSEVTQSALCPFRTQGSNPMRTQPVQLPLPAPWLRRALVPHSLLLLGALQAFSRAAAMCLPTPPPRTRVFLTI